MEILFLISYCIHIPIAACHSYNHMIMLQFFYKIIILSPIDLLLPGLGSLYLKDYILYVDKVMES